MSVCLAPSGSFFDQLALLKWRHSLDVIKAAKDFKYTAESGMTASSVIWLENTFNSDASASDDEIILSSATFNFNPYTSTARETILTSRNWNQVTSVDTYIDLFRSAGQGQALSTQYQFQLFLGLLDVDLRLEQPTRIFSEAVHISGRTRSDLVISDGQHRTVYIPDYRDFWTNIHTKLTQQIDRFASVFDILRYIRRQIISNAKVKARPARVKSKNAAFSFAPSSHEWIHGFVLLTGVSPPTQASEIDAGYANPAGRLGAKEKCHGLFCRQEDRADRARLRRTRRSGRSGEARCSPNRYRISSRKAGGNSLRGAWAHCEAASQQAA